MAPSLLQGWGPQFAAQHSPSQIARNAPKRGLAAVEFALVLPILLCVLALVVDFGRMGFDRTIVANAASLAAHAGSLEPAGEDLTDWQNKVRETAERELAQLPRFDVANVSLVAELTESPGMSWVRVELRYPYQLLFDWPMLGSEVAITQVVVVPRERGSR